MKKKILFIIGIMMTMAMLTIPVMGAPATKIEGVTMMRTGGLVIYPGYPRFVSDGTISHGRGETTPDATVTLIIPTVDTYVGDLESKWISNGNWKKDPIEIVIRSHLKLSFAGGTFEGVNQRRITGPPMAPTSIIEDHMILHGTGIFQGWTLKLSYEGTPPVIAEGYLIMPK